MRGPGGESYIEQEEETIRQRQRTCFVQRDFDCHQRRQKASRGRHLKDVPIDQLDEDLLEDQNALHDIHFFPTNANKTLRSSEVVCSSPRVLVYLGRRFHQSIRP
ncbi:hypothetical protein Adt_14357 [Abeliophyllum distichum]|uniref:Uncharacterized protein n=1 Tax=Abeliophyllum distichum TaxID=126358 RepID=A0ABD1TZE7_9LAMI